MLRKADEQIRNQSEWARPSVALVLANESGTAQFVGVIEPVLTLHGGIAPEHLTVFREVATAVHLDREMVHAKLWKLFHCRKLTARGMKVQSTSAKQPPDAVRQGECLGEMVCFMFPVRGNSLAVVYYH
jgi:hypothetical protein